MAHPGDLARLYTVPTLPAGAWWTVAQAAAALGVAVKTVRNLVSSGALPAVYCNGGWWLDPAAVLARKEKRCSETG